MVSELLLRLVSSVTDETVAVFEILPDGKVTMIVIKGAMPVRLLREQ